MIHQLQYVRVSANEIVRELDRMRGRVADAGDTIDLRDDVVERTAHLLAARVGHHAERAVLAAPFHDRDERRWPFDRRLRQTIELLDLGKRDIDNRPPFAAYLIQHLGQAVQGLRPKYNVDARRAL